jgi:HSP90 family molecular chaperone
MNDYSEQIKIPSDFFAKTLKEYQDWRFAWFRETVQNAADAGATCIDFTIEAIDDNKIKLSVTNNGCGMDSQTLRKGLLTLGGSVKDHLIQAKEQTIGGYGYAKHIILFAHQHYQIHTRDCLVSGEGSQYAIEPADDYLEGTYISVILRKVSPMAGFKRSCRTLVNEYQSDIKITLNGEVLPSRRDQYDYQIETGLGQLQFSEEESSDVTLWIRMRGLPMFHYYLFHSGQRGFVGTLDLKGEPTELLTANRDGLNFKSSGELKFTV